MRVVRCTRCGMMYQSPRIAETEMPDAYGSFEEYGKYDSLETDKRKLFVARIRRFQRECALPAAGAFLDIGASHGVMLETVRHLLPKWRAAAVEISPSARASLAARKFSAVAAIEALEPGATFDWINLDNVLEHMPDPLDALKSLKQRLTPLGFVYIDVPNESFFSIRYRVNDLVRGFPKPPTFPGHINLFTPRSLKRIVSLAGYAVDRFWLESVSTPNRLKGSFGSEETPRVRLVLKALRATRMDIALRAAYFLCARLRPL